MVHGTACATAAALLCPATTFAAQHLPGRVPSPAATADALMWRTPAMPGACCWVKECAFTKLRRRRGRFLIVSDVSAMFVATTASRPDRAGARPAAVDCVVAGIKANTAIPHAAHPSPPPHRAAYLQQDESRPQSPRGRAKTQYITRALARMSTIASVAARTALAHGRCR